MKILLVITKAEIGGAQVFVLNLAKGLKDRGVEVMVACGPGSYLTKELEYLSIPYYRFKNLKRGFNPLKNILFIKELKNYLKKNSFDVVHLNSTNALLGVFGLKKIKGLKKVFTVHGLSLIDQNYKGLKCLKVAYTKIFKIFFKYLDKIVFVSKLNYDYVIDNKIVDPIKSKLIYNGIEVDKNKIYTKNEAKKLLNICENDFIYGSIGRLAYPKNYEFLITNHRKIKEIKSNAKLVIIGEGAEREKYKGLIKTYGLEGDVILLGERKEASRYLKAFDIFILSSIYEGLSISLIEARLIGIKSIASKVGGNEEVIGKENCFKLNSNEDYIRVFKEVLNKEQDIQNKDRFNLSLMVDRYLELYDR